MWGPRPALRLLSGHRQALASARGTGQVHLSAAPSGRKLQRWVAAPRTNYLACLRGQANFEFSVLRTLSTSPTLPVGFELHTMGEGLMHAKDRGKTWPRGMQADLSMKECESRRTLMELLERFSDE